MFVGCLLPTWLVWRVEQPLLFQAVVAVSQKTHSTPLSEHGSRDHLSTNHSSPEAVLGAGEEVGEGDLHRDVLHHAPPGLVDVRTHDAGVNLQ